MKMRLKSLQLICLKSVETIVFDDVTYFYGELGAGKSTIARLIDYCLGAKQIVMTAALQNEFAAVALTLSIGEIELKIERERDSLQVLASWEDVQLVLPVRNAVGVKLPGTQVEVLSDLVFHLVGLDPPRVRKSQLNDDSDLERLSLRDLLWYSYLDQDSMDSSFFHLDRESDTFKRLKSRNVLRSILGIHQEKVAELEQKLEMIRRQRQSYSQSANVLKNSLNEADFSSVEDIEQQEIALSTRLKYLDNQVHLARDEQTQMINHVVDDLRATARQIAAELEALERAVDEIEVVNSEDRLHRNEILALSTKIRRLESARAVLNDVEFEKCPRCTRPLPMRSSEACTVCGQSEDQNKDGDFDGTQTQADIKSRVLELEEMMEAQATQLRRMRRRRDELASKKQKVDLELEQQSRQYDSRYLARTIEIEKERAAKRQELGYLARIKILPIQAEELSVRADALAADESSARRELKVVREEAEKDLSNLDLLKALFLDCLLRAKVPGFQSDDIVDMQPPWFLPELYGKSGELATTSFSTLGSGGKKNLFKCCFALAIHRLSAKLGTLLPTLLIIDSPMKNISERENRLQFEGFHQLVYELATDELAETQIILIDKEFCSPEEGIEVSLTSRHMMVDSDEDPPLITYYRGK